MEKEFVNYELSLRMKALGFDEPCFSYYELDGRLSDTPKESGDDIKYQGDCKFDNHQNTYLDEDESCSAPTWQQAFRWFREKYCLFTQPNRTVDKKGVWYYFSIETKRTDVCKGSFSYEEAELACLKKLIDIVESKS
jgi:hypothetical protein